MKYSVWNNRERAWDHYEAPGALRDGVFASTPTIKDGHAIGLTPEEASRALPLAARHVGRSDRPLGMIAEKKGILGISIAGFELQTLLVYAGVAFVGYKLWRAIR